MALTTVVAASGPDDVLVFDQCYMEEHLSRGRGTQMPDQGTEDECMSSRVEPHSPDPASEAHRQNPASRCL